MLSLPVANAPDAFGAVDFHAQPIADARVSALSLEHDDLDVVIDALSASERRDDLVIARLKKRRLQIRDEIAGLVAALQLGEAPVAAMGASGLPSDAEMDVPGHEAAMGMTAERQAAGGSALFAIFVTFLFLLVLVMSWSDLVDALDQTLAQIYVLSILAAANG